MAFNDESDLSLMDKIEEVPEQVADHPPHQLLPL